MRRWGSDEGIYTLATAQQHPEIRLVVFSNLSCNISKTFHLLRSATQPLRPDPTRFLRLTPVSYGQKSSDRVIQPGEAYLCGSSRAEHPLWLLTVVGVTFCTAHFTVHGKTRDIAAPVSAHPPADLGFRPTCSCTLCVAQWNSCCPYVSLRFSCSVRDCRTPVTSVTVYRSF